MDWEIYKEIRKYVDLKNYSHALDIINNTRGKVGSIRSYVACLESTCIEHLGDQKKALEILQKASEEPPENNFWVQHAQAALLRNMSRFKESLDATRKAQAILGWTKSQEKGYIFLHDFFSANIPIWDKWFKEIITCSPIDILEIGSWQGGSSLWLLDNVVGPRKGRLTCVDTWEGSSEHAKWITNLPKKIGDIFDHNIALCDAKRHCRKIVGRSQDVLRNISKEKFDFIYIDGAHEARYVIEDAVLAYGLLKPKGFLLFDDYDFVFDEAPQRNTRIAVDAFISIYGEEIDVIDKARQCLIRKIS